jgi:hypothetical protein
MTADQLFQAALDRRSLTYTINEDGLYLIQVGDISARINLDNVRRNYERDNDADAIERFAQQLDGEIFDDQPSWEEVRPFIRYSLEPSDYATGFDDTLHESVTDELVKIFVFTPADGSSISWITHDMVASWGVSNEDVIGLANANMDQLVRETQLELQPVGDFELGMLAVDDTPFKASLVLSPEFRSLVSSVHGWPVFVVVPARDFVYVIAQKHREFLGRLGRVVLREYNESGLPVTADVLEVGDEASRQSVRLPRGTAEKTVATVSRTSWIPLA